MRIAPTITGALASFNPNGGADVGAVGIVDVTDSSFRFAGANGTDCTYHFANGAVPAFSAEY